MSGESIRHAQNQVPMRVPPRLRAHIAVRGFESRRSRTEAMVWLHTVNGDPVTGKDKKEMKRELGLRGSDTDEMDEDIRREARGTALPEFNLEIQVEDPALRAMPRTFVAGLSEIEFIATSQATNHHIVATRWEVHGNHTEELLGVAPTGRAVSFSGITVLEFNEFPGEDGKRILRATDDWTYWDLPALMEQIGATP